jgi:hypothetical protein
MLAINVGQFVRFASLLVGLGLVVAACGGGVTAEEEATGGETDQTSDATGTSGGSDTTDESEAAPTEGSPLVVPSESTEPFDLSISATPPSEGVTVVADSPEEGLESSVRQATASWPTDWSRQTVDIGDLILGIPASDPRDRIPPIDVPRFEPIAEADWLGDREPGALVQFNDEVRFYPLSIMTRHEIVNDRFGDIPVIVTYCPLCNTAITFDARVNGEAARFGVSGLLRNSDLVMWDQSTVTLWQQLTGEAIVGELAGTKLDLIPTSIVSYQDAVDAFPQALSLSRETGFGISYGTNSYVGYSSSERPFLYDGEPDPRFPALSRVVGVTIEESSKAYPFELISEKQAVNDVVGDVPVAVWWGGETADALDGNNIAEGAAIGTGIAFDRRVDDQELTFVPLDDGTFSDEETSTTWNLLGQAIDGPLAGTQLTPLVHRNEFWFAWAAFFPEAPVYGAS